MGLKMIRKSFVLPVVLIVSLAANAILLYKYTEMAKQGNLAWSNTMTKFTQIVNYAGSDLEGWTHEPVNFDNGIETFATNFMQEELDILSYLPYAQDILPFEISQKIRVLAGYQQSVLELNEKEFKEKGNISPENRERTIALKKVWDDMLRALETKNKINPFQPVFRKKAWQKVWADGISVLSRANLPPLPEGKVTGTHMSEN